MSTTYDTRKMWNRLALLLIARPREDWESEFKEITCHEIERLAVPTEEQEGRDD